MKNKKRTILCLLLTALMLILLTACGKEKKAEDSNLFDLGDNKVLYKSACIMEDFEGNDAVVLTLDFTNNGKDSTSYLWSVSETLIQNGKDLEVATIFIDDTFSTIIENQFEEVAPGDTLEVKTAYLLDDTKGKIEVTLEDFLGTKSGKFTIDPATLSREEVEKIEGDPDESGVALPAATGDELLDWWNGAWYGWWIMNGCSGAYESMEGAWTDLCGVIDIGEDYMGTITLWDEDYSQEDPMVTAAVSLNKAGTGDYGTVYSEGGWFTDVQLEHADWIVDPGLVDHENMIWIDGYYENGDDEYHYDIYLRPWGTYWDDVDEDDRPYFYNDWYLPMIEAKKAMPGSIGADGTAEGGNIDTHTDDGDAKAADDGGSAGAIASNAGGNAPGGTGLMSDEEVQKGYVWMNEVAKDIFNTTYEELCDHFGVEGEFVKEEYSDHMKANYRYYKWISRENSNNFIYVNFKEKEDGGYRISGYNTSGFSSKEAIAKYLDIVKAEAAEADKAASANAVMKDFSADIEQFAKKDVVVKITTKIPETGWSYDESKRALVENDDPTAFGAGAMRFEVKGSVDDFDYYKDSFENYNDIEDRVIGGITFHGRTYKYIGYQWIQYVAQIDDTRALSIGLTKMECVPGTMPDIILNNMQIK